MCDCCGFVLRLHDLPHRKNLARFSIELNLSNSCITHVTSARVILCFRFARQFVLFHVRPEDEDANDIMLDGTGPSVHKPPSVANGSTGKVCRNFLR